MSVRHVFDVAYNLYQILLSPISQLGLASNNPLNAKMRTKAHSSSRKVRTV